MEVLPLEESPVVVTPDGALARKILRLPPREVLVVCHVVLLAQMCVENLVSEKNAQVLVDGTAHDLVGVGSEYGGEQGEFIA